jgi:hypothetical protein
MHQQLWGYKVEEKLYLGVWEQKRLNTTALDHFKLWEVYSHCHGVAFQKTYSATPV